MGATGGDVTAVSHGTTVATNQLLEGKIERLGFVTTEGYEFILEIARQSRPRGLRQQLLLGQAAADRSRRPRQDRPRPGSTSRARRSVRRRGRGRQRGPLVQDRGITTIGVCFLHSYANDRHELAMREILRREHPEAVVSISSEVLREYREYERTMTTLVDAAVKPSVSRYVANIHERLDQFTGGSPIPFHVMKSNGGVPWEFV